MKFWAMFLVVVVVSGVVVVAGICDGAAGDGGDTSASFTDCEVKRVNADGVNNYLSGIDNGASPNYQFLDNVLNTGSAAAKEAILTNKNVNLVKLNTEAVEERYKGLKLNSGGAVTVNPAEGGKVTVKVSDKISLPINPNEWEKVEVLENGIVIFTPKEVNNIAQGSFKLDGVDMSKVIPIAGESGKINLNGVEFIIPSSPDLTIVKVEENSVILPEKSKVTQMQKGFTAKAAQGSISVNSDEETVIIANKIQRLEGDKYKVFGAKVELIHDTPAENNDVIRIHNWANNPDNTGFELDLTENDFKTTGKVGVEIGIESMNSLVAFSNNADTTLSFVQELSKNIPNGNTVEIRTGTINGKPVWQSGNGDKQYFELGVFDNAGEWYLDSYAASNGPDLNKVNSQNTFGYRNFLGVKSSYTPQEGIKIIPPVNINKEGTQSFAFLDMDGANGAEGAIEYWAEEGQVRTLVRDYAGELNEAGVNAYKGKATSINIGGLELLHRPTPAEGDAFDGQYLTESKGPIVTFVGDERREIYGDFFNNNVYQENEFQSEWKPEVARAAEIARQNVVQPLTRLHSTLTNRRPYIDYNDRLNPADRTMSTNAMVPRNIENYLKTVESTDTSVLAVIPSAQCNYECSRKGHNPWVTDAQANSGGSEMTQRFESEGRNAGYVALSTTGNGFNPQSNDQILRAKAKIQDRLKTIDSLSKNANAMDQASFYSLNEVPYVIIREPKTSTIVMPLKTYYAEEGFSSPHYYRLPDPPVYRKP